MRICFKTVGCRLNQAETALLAGQFLAHGHEIVPFGQPCDICVIHGCAVTQRAIRDTIRFARTVKERFGTARVVIAGCPVEIERELLTRQSAADLLVDQAAKRRLVELLGGRGKGELEQETVLPHFATTRALIKVQDGCDFNCSYCVVPKARGPVRSRPLPQIVTEIRRLAEAGFKEVVLTGANLGCFNDSGRGLCDLLREIEQIEGIQRIRLSSIELTTVERDVINLMSDSQKLCHYLHVPLQSGADRILKAMGRRYTVSEYRSFVDFALKRIPRLGLGTDILVGFPGEDQQAFDLTLRLMGELPFSNLHVFPYSKRPNTPAACLPNQISEGEKHSRVKEMLAVARLKRSAFARQFLGVSVSVLIESVQGEVAFGWTEEYVRALVREPGARVNDIVSFVPSSLVDGMLT